MNADKMDGAGRDDMEKGSVIFSGERAATEVVDDEQADLNPALSKRKLTVQHELKRAQSVVDLTMSWLIWVVFAVAVVVGGLAAPVIVLMEGATPISLACWRIQVSAVVMLPIFIFDWRKLSKCDRSKAFTTVSLELLFCSSLSLAAQVAFHCWTLNHTSMTRCLLISGLSPIFVAIHTKLTGGMLAFEEIAGVSLGLLGVAILAAGTKFEKDNQSTNMGDFVALLTSVAMAVYLITGKKLRSWMPLFVFQFPVTAISCIMLGIAALLLEGWNNSDVGNVSGLFGWLRKEYILGTIFLGIGPGLIGQAGYSFVIRYASPLVMPTGISLQPIIGSSVGWALGVSPTPGLWTCLGGAVTLSGTLLVTCSTAAQKAQVEDKEEEHKQPATDDEEAQQGTKPLLQPSEP